MQNAISVVLSCFGICLNLIQSLGNLDERSEVENRNKGKGAQSKTNVDTDVPSYVSSYLKTANAGIIMKRFVWFVKKW